MLISLCRLFFFFFFLLSSELISYLLHCPDDGRFIGESLPFLMPDVGLIKEKSEVCMF